MKKIAPPIAIFLVFGLMLVSIAVLAEAIGLDKNPGDWSKPRIAIFATGLFLILLAEIWFHFGYKFNVAVTRSWSLLQRHPAAIWISRNEAVLRPLRLVRRYFLTISIPVTILLFYAWLASSGTWTTWKSPTIYYSILAEAFLNGNLHLSLQPDPQLLALENPYDPSVRAGIETPVDLSLYDGKFYMYWGPAPSLLLVILQFFIHNQMGDLTLTFIFVCGIFLAQSAMLSAIWKHYFFSILPKWTLHLSILLGGLTGPIILLRHNYENARIYEASIAGGQFFLISGLLLVFSAIASPSLPSWRLVLAGGVWALAIGTRQILVGPIGIMVILTAFRVITTSIKPLAKLRKLFLLSLPLFLGFICLSWYNWARFHSITETGLYYQLAGPYLREHYTELFSKSYVLQNIYNYFFNPPDFTSKFPFVSMLKGNENPILSFYTVPEFYNAQPVTGLMYLFPFAVFAILPLIALSRSLYDGGPSGFISDGKEPNSSIWLSLNLGSSFLIACCLLLVFFWAGLRYLGDFIPELMVLSALGFWQGYVSFTHRPMANGLYVFFGISLAGISILISTLLAISTNSKLINLISHNFPFLQ